MSMLRSILPTAPGLSHCWYHLMLFCFAFVLICFWINLIVHFTSEFNLSCTDLCKASTDDGDQVISLMVVFIAEIKCNYFYVILSILLSGAGLIWSVLACRLLGTLDCITRRLYI